MFLLLPPLLLAASDKFESMEEPDLEFCELMDNLGEIGDSEIVSKLIMNYFFTTFFGNCPNNLNSN